MTKVEEGVCSGKVMWHERIQKTSAEVQEMDELWETRRREKEARKKIQRENIEKKRKAKGGNAKTVDREGDDEDEMDVNEWDSEGLEGDGEMVLNEDMDGKGEWEDEEEEIAAG